MQLYFECFFLAIDLYMQAEGSMKGTFLDGDGMILLSQKHEARCRSISLIVGARKEIRDSFSFLILSFYLHQAGEK
jgi:hypothetical protein